MLFRSFTVDSGFSYLVRLHFCEIQANITKINQRSFGVFLYNQIAEPRVDAIFKAGLAGVPVCKDYLVLVPNGSPQ